MTIVKFPRVGLPVWFNIRVSTNEAVTDASVYLSAFTTAASLEVELSGTWFKTS
jgi:hypothetical protein